MIGIDLVAIERMELFLARRSRARTKEEALARFLVPSEIELVRRVESAAGFWAAKEACAKALGTGIGAEVRFHDMIISKSPKGAPLLELSKEAKERFNVASCALSIAHHKGFAIAAVLLVFNQ